MPTVKKEGLASAIVLSADAIQSFLAQLHISIEQIVFMDINFLFDKVRSELEKDRLEFRNMIFSEKGLGKKMWKLEWSGSIIAEKYILTAWIEQIKIKKPTSVDAIVTLMHDCVRMSEDVPVKLSPFTWLFKGFCYSVEGPYTDEEFRLLILEDFDTERRHFERLKQKHDSTGQERTRSRIRIPEQVRVEVWRRDGGKCTRCNSRENLEYDHIVPLSRGGSNTTRNIELLCEKCNRSKGANIG